MASTRPGASSKLKMSFASACLLLLFTSAQPGLSQQAQEIKNGNANSQSPLVIRVGAIYYDNSAEDYQRVRAILAAFESAEKKNNNSNRREIAFKLVVGTYDEVYHWFRSDQIDLAVMNPAPLALLLKEYGRTELEKGFVGTREIAPSSTSKASEGGQGARSNRYNSMILVNREALQGKCKEEALRPKCPALDSERAPTDEEAKQIMDLVLELSRQRQTHFLFVHPFSTSGYIFPRKFLKEQTKIDLDLSDYELTYSHDVSLNEVLKAKDSNGRLKVAFVSDHLKNTKDNPQLLTLKSGYSNTTIVQDALLFTPDFVQRESAELDRLKKLLRTKNGESQGSTVEQPTFNLSEVKDWWKPYEEVGRWIDTFTNNKPLMSSELTLDQIIRRITNYNLHHPEEPARVALVLSGGGAKCAYQLGAVEVIEDKFQQAQKETGTEKPSIDLVVGTSGGAINALTIAAEVTKEKGRRDNLKSTWERFNQSEILRLSELVQGLLGLTIGFLVSLVVVNWFNYRRLVLSTFGEANRIIAWSRVGWLLIAIALVLYLLGHLEITLTSWLTAETLLQRHVWIHIMEYGSQTLRWAAVSILISGIVLCLNRSLAARRNLLFAATAVAAFLFITLPIATLYTTLKVQNSLFVSSGIEEKMALEIPKLLNCRTCSEPSSKRMAEISKEIIDHGGLIKRDLVITGSILSSGSSSKQSDTWRQAENETDLYFVYTPENSALTNALPKDNRFVSLNDPVNRPILLDAVIGSGAIFPAFEPRKLTSVKRVMDKKEQPDVAIIDGGFVHNSPIEAAIKLKATHIIMIEASPEYSQSEEVNLLSNTVVAFNHLFTQAQLLDARSRRQAEIFTLRPHQDPFLCTLDFGSKYITKAVEWGAKDACDTTTPRFVRQPRPSGL